MRTAAVLAVAIVYSTSGAPSAVGDTKPCGVEAQAYIDSAESEAPQSGSALLKCLFSARKKTDASAESSIRMLTLTLPSAPPPRTPPGGTWLPLPPDILALLAANGYADFVSTGGLMVDIPGALLEPAISELLLESEISIPQADVSPFILGPQDIGPMDGGMGGGGMGGGGLGQ